MFSPPPTIPFTNDYLSLFPSPHTRTTRPSLCFLYVRINNVIILLNLTAFFPLPSSFSFLPLLPSYPLPFLPSCTPLRPLPLLDPLPCFSPRTRLPYSITPPPPDTHPSPYWDPATTTTNTTYSHLLFLPPPAHNYPPPRDLQPHVHFWPLPFWVWCGLLHHHPFNLPPPRQPPSTRCTRSATRSRRRTWLRSPSSSKRGLM